MGSALKDLLVCSGISKTVSHVEETCKGQGLTVEEVRGDKKASCCSPCLRKEGRRRSAGQSVSQSVRGASGLTVEEHLIPLVQRGEGTNHRRGRGGGSISGNWNDRSCPPSFSSFTVTFVENLLRTGSTAVHAYSIKMPAWFSLSFATVIPSTYPIFISLSLDLSSSTHFPFLSHELNSSTKITFCTLLFVSQLHLKKLWRWGKILIYPLKIICNHYIVFCNLLL